MQPSSQQGGSVSRSDPHADDAYLYDSSVWEHTPRGGSRMAGMSFTPEEARDLGKAWIAVSLAFAILDLGGFDVFTADMLSLGRALAVSGITVGIGFVLHEMGHKYLAQRYGCRATFRSFDGLLLVALATSFFGMVFAAPGAVFISGAVTYDKSGRIAAAGPLVNIALASLFLLLSLLIPSAGSFLSYGAWINAFLAVFNMLPFGSFDGAKVWLWNSRAYFALLGASAALLLAVQFI